MVFFEGQYLPIIVQLIKQAKTELLIMCYEWAWYPSQRTGTAQDINRAVVHAAQRGVKVSVILHHDNPNSHLSKINRKTASRLRRHHVQVKLGSPRKIIHAKFWVFDGSTAVICTHNISNRAVQSNAEIGVVITDPDSVRRTRAYFFSLWEDRSMSGQ